MALPTCYFPWYLVSLTGKSVDDRTVRYYPNTLPKVYLLWCLYGRTFQIRRFPGTIQMVQSNEPVLYVGTSTEFRSGTHQDSYLPCPHLCKQLRFSYFRIIFMNKCDLLFRDSPFHQLVSYIIIHVECSIIFRCAEVAEDQLGSLCIFSVLPYLESILHTGIYLAFPCIR